MKLDIGCGYSKAPGYIGMDIRPLPGVDIVQDIEKLPWDIKDETFEVVFCSHILEHINPKLHVDIMNEIWRITKPSGVLTIGMPYAGSFNFWQDPTHIHAWNEATPQYFDPGFPLYKVYRPKPWRIQRNSFNPQENINVLFVKIKEEIDYANFITN